MKPLYQPKGKAREYGEYAVNIYTGCPHACTYCFAPSVLYKERETFHSDVVPREGIVEALRAQIAREGITDKLIHLCFTCDPYPSGVDTTVTREVIKAIKESGNHVQILTKGDGSRDFDLLDEKDWYGITLSCIKDAPTVEPHALPPLDRLVRLEEASFLDINTWISFEPVMNAEEVLGLLARIRQIPETGGVDLFADIEAGENWTYVDKIKIGKLNYHHSDIDWADFGTKAEQICKEHGLNYYIKDSLREAMERIQGVKKGVTR